MTDLIKLAYSGVSCNASGCEARHECPATDVIVGLSTHYRELVQAGWSVWAGRGRRHYCSQHKPKPGHRMREITARYRSG